MLKETHNLSISCIRLLAFSFIITCHIQQYLEIGLCWWFNVGVQIFLGISGYLYGGKNITDELEFYKRKFMQILVPYYITVIVVILIQFVFFNDIVNLSVSLKVMLCNSTLKGGEHLWFIPTILMCYVLTPFFEKIFFSDNYFLFSVIRVFFVIVIVFEFFLNYYNSAWIACFFVGYILGYTSRLRMLKEKSIITIAVLVLTIVFNFIQIFLTYVVKIDLGDRYKHIFQLFCDYAHLLLGISIFIIFNFVFSFFFKRERDCSITKIISKITQWSDKYSYEWYLVHQFFIFGPISLMNTTNYIIANIILVLISTFICAFLLKKAELFALQVKKH